MRLIGATAYGTVTSSTGQTEAFNTFTDTVAEASLGTTQQAEDIIMSRDPGAFVIEVMGGAFTDKNASIVLHFTGIQCPSGTH
jgi:hypothetical protein